MNANKNIALVTGANKGLGFATAQLLGHLDHTVIIGARDSERGKQAELSLKNEGIDVKFVLLDVRNAEHIGRAVAEIENRFGRLDVLINNAGIGIQHGIPSEMNMSELKDTMDTNFFGPFAVTKAFLPLLRNSQSGRIVNISSSLASLFYLPDTQWYLFENDATAYAISKSALNSLTVLFAKELRNTSIKINSVDPGYVITDLTKNMGLKTPQEAAKLVVRYATLPEDGPSGGFFDEDGSKPW